MDYLRKQSQLIGRRELIAVLDESGGVSNRPGDRDEADFSVAAVIFSGRRAWRDLVNLDQLIQNLVGKRDYKYRQVQLCEDARTAFVDALRRQSGLIRVYGYYAAGGAFVNQAERELRAVQLMGNEPKRVEEAKENLAKYQKNPWGEGLRDAINTSIPALSVWAGDRKRRISVYFDERTDLSSIASSLLREMGLWDSIGLHGSAYANMDWGGECPEHLQPISRIADLLAGDIRKTFRKYGDVIWKQLEADGFVGRHHEVPEKYEVEWAGLVPVPKVGFVSNNTWGDEWNTASKSTTLFGAYHSYAIAGRISLYSPTGCGCYLVSHGNGFKIFQVLD